MSCSPNPTWATAVKVASDSSACSTSTRVYRDKLAGDNVVFVHVVGSQEAIAQRLAARTGHYMPASLLESQFATLEAPGEDENVIPVLNGRAPADEATEIIRRLRLTPGVHGTVTQNHREAGKGCQHASTPARDIMGPVIELAGLTKVFGRTRAVDDLTCSVEPGMVTGFLGPNGAGKTTTMRLILGLDHPTAGTATIDRRTYRELKDPLRTVGALLDARHAHPNRSARNHLRWIAATNRIPAERVDEVLEMVGLTSIADRNVGTLSLGMSQRLGIAAALLGDPPVLLFDEPVNGLDPEGIRWVRTLMRTLASQGRTVFVSSHLLAEMANTADRLIVIGKGKLIAATTVAEFVGRSGAETVRVRSPQLDTLRRVLTDAGLTAEADQGSALLVRGAAIEVIGELAARNAITLHELSAQRASLEEAYMQLTDEATEYRAVSQ